MLDDDTFAWFEKNGGLTRQNGQRFRDMILSRGHTQDYGPMFRAFYGKDPDIEPMLASRGLTVKKTSVYKNHFSIQGLITLCFEQIGVHRGINNTIPPVNAIFLYVIVEYIDHAVFSPIRFSKICSSFRFPKGLVSFREILSVANNIL